MNDQRRPEPTERGIRAALTREPDMTLTRIVARELSLALAAEPQRHRGIRWPWSPTLPAIGRSPMPWRFGLATNLVILLLLVALAVAALAFVGSIQRLPPPYGLARAGLIAFDAGGDIVVAKADGTDRRQLTSGPARELQPTWSPDGTRLAYQSLAAHANLVDLVVIDADGSNPRVVASKPATIGIPGFPTVSWWQVSWAPDSRRLVYTGWSAGRPRMFIAREDGSEVAQVGPSNLDAEDPAWSPDGTRIAFFGGRYDDERGLFIMDADGSNVRRLTSIRPGESSTDSYREPAWSPDGTLIAYSVGITRGTAEVRTLNVEDGVERVISLGRRDTDSNYAPRWSPDGSRIAWLALCCGDQSSRLIVARTDGSDEMEFPAGFLGAPVWSPDGRSVFGLTQRIARSYDPITWITPMASSSLTSRPGRRPAYPPEAPTRPSPSPLLGDGSWQRLAR